MQLKQLRNRGVKVIGLTAIKVVGGCVYTTSIPKGTIGKLTGFGGTYVHPENQSMCPGVEVKLDSNETQDTLVLPLANLQLL